MTFGAWALVVIAPIILLLVAVGWYVRGTKDIGQHKSVCRIPADKRG